MSHFCFNPSCSVYICNPTWKHNECLCWQVFQCYCSMICGRGFKTKFRKISESCPINMVTKSHDLMINSNFLWRTAPKLTKGKTGLQIDDITLRNNVYKYKLNLAEYKYRMQPNTNIDCSRIQNTTYCLRNHKYKKEKLSFKSMEPHSALLSPALR